MDNERWIAYPTDVLLHLRGSWPSDFLHSRVCQKLSPKQWTIWKCVCPILSTLMPSPWRPTPWQTRTNWTAISSTCLPPQVTSHGPIWTSMTRRFMDIMTLLHEQLEWLIGMQWCQIFMVWQHLCIKSMVWHFLQIFKTTATMTMDEWRPDKLCCQVPNLHIRHGVIRRSSL